MYLTEVKKIKGTSDYDAHQILWTLFEDRQSPRPFCFSEYNDVIYMLSSVKPLSQSKKIIISNNSTLIFSVTASPPTRRFKEATFKPQDYTAKELKKWFKKVFVDSANINFVSFDKLPPKSLYNNKGHKMVWSQYRFYGSLTVTDAEEFEKRITKGIGKGSGFGLGFMVIRDIIDM